MTVDAKVMQSRPGGHNEYFARRERQKINKENARNKAREFIATYLSEHHCVDCGESDSVVLTFDHVRGQKLSNISDMVGNGLSVEAIRTEIEKTEVTCFNCHTYVRKREAGHIAGKE